MLLQKLVLFNFRQFKGRQEVDFAYSDRRSNLTIIYGENGRGKTSILRAIMFCLYGDSTLSQDEGASKEELFLINSSILIQSRNEKKSVPMYVELQFKHKQEGYILNRSMKGMLEHDRQIEQKDSITLTIKRNDGNTEKLNDPEQIADIIDLILDKNIKDYFLFDGEKIQKLTLANQEQKKAISKFIKNLLNVDSLEKAQIALKNLKKKFRNEIEKKATGEYKKVINNIKAIEDKIEDDKISLKQIDLEIRTAEFEKKEVDKKLQQFENIKHLVEKRRLYEENLAKENNQKDNILMEMRSKTSIASRLLIRNTISEVFQNIDKKKQIGDLPSEIRKDLIEKLLSAKLCICGRDLITGTDSFNKIIDWKNKTCDFEIEKSIIDVWADLKSIINQFDDLPERIESLLQKYAISTNEISKLESQIDKIGNEIGNSERADAAKLEQHRDKIEQSIRELNIKYDQLSGGIEENKKQLELENANRIKLEKDELIKNEIVDRANLTESTLIALDEIYNNFTNEIKQTVTVDTNIFLKDLLDDEGKKILDKIKINDDYSLQLYDIWGKPFLANISAGQRQIISIAFILALAKAASGGNILEMPLFMDTPLARLSFEHRKKIIEIVPLNCAQWILLVTDTEFSQEEAKIIIRTKKCKSFYSLRSDEAGVTAIHPHSIEDIVPYLKAKMESNE